MLSVSLKDLEQVKSGEAGTKGALSKKFFTTDEGEENGDSQRE